MDIKAYIESGILELYVLGAATEAEMAEVEQAIAAHPEIKEAVLAIEKSLEHLATAQSVTPPPALKGKVLQAVAGAIQNDLPKAKVVAMPAPEKRSKFSWVAAASISGLILSLGGNYYLYNTNKSLQATLVRTQEELNGLNGDYSRMYTAYNDLKSNMDMVMDTASVMVHMKGLKSPDVATIVWDANRKEVFLAVDQLAKPPQGKQYQLWAIVDNTPVDLGVFNADTHSFELQKMKAFDGLPSAFAVTVEKEGGSPTPTLEMLWLMGPLNS